jgi:hypothetical protein
MVISPRAFSFFRPGQIDRLDKLLDSSGLSALGLAVFAFEYLVTDLSLRFQCL